MQIFLAHAKEDNEAVRSLHRRLEESGYTPWMDEINLRAGERWEDVIERVISESDIFLACFTTFSVKKRGYIQTEIRYALK